MLHQASAPLIIKMLTKQSEDWRKKREGKKKTHGPHMPRLDLPWLRRFHPQILRSPPPLGTQVIALQMCTSLPMLVDKIPQVSHRWTVGGVIVHAVHDLEAELRVHVAEGWVEEVAAVGECSVYVSEDGIVGGLAEGDDGVHDLAELEDVRRRRIVARDAGDDVARRGVEGVAVADVFPLGGELFLPVVSTNYSQLELAE